MLSGTGPMAWVPCPFFELSTVVDVTRSGVGVFDDLPAVFGLFGGHSDVRKRISRLDP